MCAALILCLARTSRLAMVGSATRKARATSAVVRPPSSRSVKAICASMERAGWQHVKMRRSRSSCTGPDLLSRCVGDLGHLRQKFAPARLAAEVIDGSIAGGRRDPAARVRRQAVDGPLPQGEGEGLLDRVLGEVDVAEDADQGGHRPTGLLAEDPADQRVVDDRQAISRRPCPRTARPRSATRSAW